MRKQLRVLKEFIHGFDFLRFSPNDAVIKGCTPAGLRVTRVLADRGRAYAIYVRARSDADRFSVRWTGAVTPQHDETFTFHTISNDGVRLWVNGQLLIDNPRDHPLVEDQGKMELRAE